MQLSEEFDCMILTYFSTSSGVVRNTKSDLAAFLRFFPCLINLKYSLKFMAHQSRFLNNHQYLEYTTLSFCQNFLSESD